MASSLGVSTRVSQESLRVDLSVIGRGAFGSVVTARNKQNQRYAVKMIRNTLPSDQDNKIVSVNASVSHTKHHKGAAVRLLLEPVIMMSIRHPHLMIAENVIADNSSMMIVMPLSMGALGCREVLEFSRLQRWSIELISAIATLHHHQIIHGDVKPPNILLLKEDHIALTDFGQSVIKEHPAEDFAHRIGTHTYRAPESLLKQRWTEKVDIWGLGCTLYEMAYGQVLFPSQQDWECGMDLDKNTVKANTSQRSINAIVDWCGLHAYQMSEVGLKITKDHLLYHHVKLHTKWTDPFMTVFNDLVVKLLHPEPNQRPSITDVLNHPWVKISSGATNITASPPYATLHLAPVKNQIDIIRLCNVLSGYFALPTRVNESTTFFHKTAELYQKVNLDSQDQVLVMLGCGWIIGKLYYHRIFSAKVGEHLPELPDVELAILTNIGYCIDL